MPIAGGNGQLTAARHCVARVGGEVCQARFKLRRIDHGRPYRGVQFQNDGNGIHNPEHLPGFVIDSGPAHRHVDDGAVLATAPGFEVSAARWVFGDAGNVAAEIRYLLGAQIRRKPAKRFLLTVAEHALGRGGPQHDVAVGVDHEDPDGRRLEYRAQLPVGAGELLCALPDAHRQVAGMAFQLRGRGDKPAV